MTKAEILKYWLDGAKENRKASADVDLTLEKILNEITSFNLDARYDDYKRSSHPFLPEDFNNKFNPLATEIKKTGVKVV